MSTETHRARIARACLSLQGLSLGDALGEQFFVHPHHVKQLIQLRAMPGGNWRWTDDTAMAISIVEVLRDCQKIDENELAKAFSKRYFQEPMRGYGGGAHRVLGAIGAGEPWESASASLFDGQGSKGNGGAMRSAPIGGYFADDLSAVVENATRSAKPTHSHPEGVAGAVAIAVAAALVVSRDECLDGKDLLEAVAEKTPKGETRKGILDAVKLGFECPVDTAVERLGNGSRILAEDTVPFSLWCAARHLNNFTEAMWTTVSGLGDRDTTCAIVGGIVALRVGVEGLPVDWMAQREALPFGVLVGEVDQGVRGCLLCDGCAASMAERLSMAPPAGSIIAGKYRVERVLGEGGMGVVVAALHLQFDTMVAVKLLHPEVVRAAPDVLQRFLTEARAAVRLKSEHIARVMDVGTAEAGEPYLVMEYLEGSDLSNVIISRGGLDIGTAVDYLIQACDGLATAHAQGIIHRDIKPANLFVTMGADGVPCIKILDFGIAKATGTASGMGMTKTTTMMGTPLYMSPEQMHSAKNVDVRADVWSLGVIFYQMLAGDVPFHGDTMPELVLSVVQKPLPALPPHRTDVSRELWTVLETSLSKDPATRFQSVGAFARALAPWASDEGKLMISRISRVLGETTANNPNSAVAVSNPVSVATQQPASISNPVLAQGKTDLGMEQVNIPVTSSKGPIIAASLIALVAIIAAVVFLTGSGRSGASENVNAGADVSAHKPIVSATTTASVSASTASVDLPVASNAAVNPVPTAKAPPEKTNTSATSTGKATSPKDPKDKSKTTTPAAPTGFGDRQ